MGYQTFFSDHVNRKWTYAHLDSGFAHIFGQIISIRVKILSNTNSVASRHIKMQKASLPMTSSVDEKCLCLSCLLSRCLKINLGFEHGSEKRERGKEEKLFSNSHKLYYSEACDCNAHIKLVSVDLITNYFYVRKVAVINLLQDLIVYQSLESFK